VAEGEDQESKTEEPSQKKLADAREKGQVPRSHELNHLVLLGSGLALILMLLPGAFASLTMVLRPFLEQPHAMPTDSGGLGALLTELLMRAGLALAFPLLLPLIASVLGSILQTGWMVTPENVMKFDFKRINPLSNLTQKLSRRNLVEFGKALLKLAVVGAVVVSLLWPMLSSAEHFVGMPLEALVAETRHLAGRLMIGVLIILAVLAAADFLYQRFEFMQNMRMTKQEVKDEYKQTEGDPLIKSKIREKRILRARSRMMQNVPQADVVVTNPTHYAVALKYDPGTMAAPVVLAKGVDNIAAKIREIAEENGVPLVANPPLARALYATAEIDQEIPAEHYKAVAQVISYVFKLKRRPIPN
jgi:flagellar biosynthetic protein FlhB